MTSSPSHLRLSVLVPLYNEEQTVKLVLMRLLELGELLEEVIVVDDGSTDRSLQVAREAAQMDDRIRVFASPRNAGKTDAIRRALAEARGGIIMIQDADLEYDPREIPEVISPILENQADVVYGSRFLVRRAARVLYFYHFLANRFLTFLSNILTNRNMTDIETCYKAFVSGIVKPLNLTSKGFGMEVELTAMICRTRARTYEVPISYYGRTFEEGKKIRYRDGIAAIWYIFYYNVIAPRLPSGRAYIRAANEALERRRASASD